MPGLLFFLDRLPPCLITRTPMRRLPGFLAHSLKVRSPVEIPRYLSRTFACIRRRRRGRCVLQDYPDSSRARSGIVLWRRRIAAHEDK